MGNIKEAFSKVKQDIETTSKEILNLKKELYDTRERLIEICNLISVLNTKINNLSEKRPPTNPQQTNTEIQTYPTDNPTDIELFKPLKPENLGISTGNEGVPTDKQTNRQTNRQTNFEQNIGKTDSLQNTFDILGNLDSFKKELRLKFKRLTDQEFTVFSTLFEVEDEFGYSDYKTIANRLNLTESSIRDYVGRLIKKGIPVEKVKINNKAIQLTISSNFRKVVSLQTLIQLRAI